MFPGLFHRAILMSGTALADWAVTRNPLKFTIQVAQALNCPLVERDDELAACLRRKRLSELLAVRVQAPPFVTPFGPVVDGSVVPNEPRLLMGVYKDLFSRYVLLITGDKRGRSKVQTVHHRTPKLKLLGLLNYSFLLYKCIIEFEIHFFLNSPWYTFLSICEFTQCYHIYDNSCANTKF